MKLILSLVLILFSVQLLFSQTPGQTKDIFGEKVVNIVVTQPWTPTGINCAVGDTLFITVCGIFSGSMNDPSAWCGPDGNGWGSTSIFPVPTASQYSVIGKFGSGGTGFPVGAMRLLVADAAGELNLGINDIVNFTDNGGTLVATVIKQRNHILSSIINTGGPIGPINFNVNQNYPNPFNPSTTIEYSVNQSDNVQINIFDQTGRLINTLFEGEKGIGTYKIMWNGNNSVGKPVSSGTYYYQVRVGSEQQTKKAVLLK